MTQDEAAQAGHEFALVLMACERGVQLEYANSVVMEKLLELLGSDFAAGWTAIHVALRLLADMFLQKNGGPLTEDEVIRARDQVVTKFMDRALSPELREESNEGEESND